MTLKQMFDRAVLAAERRSWTHGRLGRVNADASVTLQVVARPGFVYVRLGSDGTGDLTVARNTAGVPLRAHLPVKMRLEQGVMVIYGQGEEAAQLTNESPFGLAKHHHRIGSGLEYEHQALLFERGRIRWNGTGLQVYIGPFRYRHGGTWKTWPGGSVDLASLKPGTAGHWAWVVVGVDPATNTLATAAGSSVVYATALEYGDLDGVAFEGIPCGAVRVRNDDTSLEDVARYTDAQAWLGGHGLYVELTGDQTVAGVKTWSDNARFNALLTGPTAVRVNTDSVISTGSRLTVYESEEGSDSRIIAAFRRSYAGGASSAGFIFLIENPGTAGIARIIASGTTTMNLVLGPVTNQLYLQRVSGNVGIGVASPGKPLDINGDVRIRGDLATLNFYRTTGPTDIAYIQYDETNQRLDFAANNKHVRFLNLTGFAESMRITNVGDIGIGHSTPATRVWIHTGEIGFNQPNTSTDGIIWKNRGYAKFSAAIRPVSLASHARQGIAFYTGDAADTTTDAVERMRIERNGLVGINTISPGEMLDVAGNIRATGKIYTSEGTWTCTITGSPTPPTITLINNTGNYVLVGKLCFVQFTAQISSISGGSGVVRFGLPFTASSIGRMYLSGTRAAGGGTIQFICDIDPSAAYGVGILDAATAYVQVSGLASGQIWRFSGCYIIA